MRDNVLRRAKDALLLPVARRTGKNVNPITITLVAGIVGVLAAYAGFRGEFALGLGLFWLNRILDGFDGAVARVSGRQTDMGAYADTLLDFLIYTSIPFALTMRDPSLEKLVILAFLLGTFYVNAAAFLYLSAILERRQQGAKARGELTAITMPSGVVEGAEAVVFYSLFFLLPDAFPLLMLILGSLVIVTILQHVFWSLRHLKA